MIVITSLERSRILSIDFPRFNLTSFAERERGTKEEPNEIRQGNKGIVTFQAVNVMHEPPIPIQMNTLLCYSITQKYQTSLKHSVT